MCITNFFLKKEKTNTKKLSSLRLCLFFLLLLPENNNNNNKNKNVYAYLSNSLRILNADRPLTRTHNLMDEDTLHSQTRTKGGEGGGVDTPEFDAVDVAAAQNIIGQGEEDVAGEGGSRVGEWRHREVSGCMYVCMYVSISIALHCLHSGEWRGVVRSAIERKRLSPLSHALDHELQEKQEQVRALCRAHYSEFINAVDDAEKLRGDVNQLKKGRQGGGKRTRRESHGIVVRR